MWPDENDAVTGPLVLTARAYLRAYAEVAAGLRAARCSVRAVTSWDRLLLHDTPCVADIVLVDLDAVDRARAQGTRGLSGYRLVTLLTRQIARTPTALIIQTLLDYTEIEDLVRRGVQDIISPRLDAEECVQRILAVPGRRTSRRKVVVPRCAIPVDAAEQGSEHGRVPVQVLVAAATAPAPHIASMN